METAVRRTSIGEPLDGTVRSSSMIFGSSLRASASLRVKSASSRGVGQLAEPEEVGCLFKSGALGELVNVDAAVGEDPRVAVDPADRRVGGDDAFQSLWCDGGGHNVSFSRRN